MAEIEDKNMPQQGGVQDRKDRKNRFWDTVEGVGLERRFSSSTIAWIIAIALFAVAHIANNYSGMRKIGQISELNKELKELRMEHVTVSTQLMGEQRLSSIEEHVKNEGLTIEIPKTSPIVIER